MTDYDLKKAERLREEALQNYKDCMANMMASQSPELAQSVNDAWLKFKKLDVDCKNNSTMKRIEDLYNY